MVPRDVATVHRAGAVNIARIADSFVGLEGDVARGFGTLARADITGRSTVPAQASVFDVAAVKYAMVVPGDRAGEWQMSCWSSRDWAPHSFAMGL